MQNCAGKMIKCGTFEESSKILGDSLVPAMCQVIPTPAAPTVQLPAISCASLELRCGGSGLASEGRPSSPQQS